MDIFVIRLTGSINHIISYYQNLGFFLQEFSIIFRNYSPKQERLIIDYFENDLVNFNGEKVPYYLLNPELTSFNEPRSKAPKDSDEWWFGFLKKHNMIDYGDKPKTNIFDSIVEFIVNKEREYKSEVINYVKSKDQMVKTNAISNQIKKMIDNGILESVSQSGQSVLSKGRYWNTHINLKGDK